MYITIISECDYYKLSPQITLDYLVLACIFFYSLKYRLVSLFRSSVTKTQPTSTFDGHCVLRSEKCEIRVKAACGWGCWELSTTWADMNQSKQMLFLRVKTFFLYLGFSKRIALTLCSPPTPRVVTPPGTPAWRRHSHTTPGPCQRRTKLLLCGTLQLMQLGFCWRVSSLIKLPSVDGLCDSPLPGANSAC